ncbi:conserved hypothetical protein [Candidatus Terasakiella magnetica]|uniref:Magnetosome protein MamD n=1 Tax=Candidatus Terasakiella magnetica TaxID=1867952 RepID=A0A1C3RFR6_9PROT|nr:magnetosome protein MamD [Candidatus Terasakiella magnetica]SCA56098.1 conserved hypothetical protein [Candidatus Terasakiella magnetica]
MLLLKAEQARSVPALVGKTFKVGSVTKAGGAGAMVNNQLLLQPVGASAGKDVVMLKVTGAGQQLPSLVGKTFTFGKSPVLGKAGMNYLALHPAAGAKAAAGAAAATKGTVAVKLTNAKAAAQLQAFQGKAFVVGKAPIMGNNIANKMLVLHPLKGAGAKAGAGVAATAAAEKGVVIGKTTIGSAGVISKGAGAAAQAPNVTIMLGGTGKTVAATAGKTVAAKTAVATTGKAVATKAAAATAGKAAAGKAAAAAGATAAAGTAASGTIWTGTGLSLGLGLGLGALGPVLLTAAAATGGYYLYQRNKAAEEECDGDVDECEALINPPAPSGNVAPA